MKLRATMSAILLCGVVAALSAQGPDKTALMNPAGLKEQAPATYQAKFETSAGDFVVTVHRAWSPLGADRFYNMVKNGFFDDCRFFRVVPGFMVQFGINGDPKVQRNWVGAQLKDDPKKETNSKGRITFATAGPNSRTTQVFINYGNNAGLDAQGFTPFGEVTSGMAVVEKINSTYGEKPEQGSIQAQGNAYLNKQFPKLDFIKKASIEK